MIKLVEEYGTRRWGLIGSKLNGRTGKQCRERWHNQLDPNINKNEWTEEEEQRLLDVSLSSSILASSHYPDLDIYTCFYLCILAGPQHTG
jgi:hypothetical protein